MKEYFKDLAKHKRFWMLPLFTLIWNESVYNGGRLLTKHRFHYEFVTELDRKIPLVPWTIIIYFSCFLVWALVYLYMASRDKRTAYVFTLSDFLGKCICLVFFLLLPTTLERPEITGGGLWNCLMRFLYMVDASDNLFPSIHCLVSWYCWIGLRGRKDCPWWWRYGMLLFAIAVCISTLTTKQHVLIDVLGAILIAEFTYLIANKLIPLSQTETAET